MANDTGFGWESLLVTDSPPDAPLKAALFTTYDRPDERFLVEHLLPVILKMERDADTEGLERQLFFAELHERLIALRGRLAVISSFAPRSEDDAPLYPWLWRFVRPLTVGRMAPAVQHAKLWMLHWGATVDDETEYLELVISSTNLTTAAFKHQLQASWRVCLPLHRKPSQQRRAAWGVLPHFLGELADSAGDPRQLDHFIALLECADCPGVDFVASVPGRHDRGMLRRSPWGLAALDRVAPSGHGRTRVRVLAPSVGTWTTEMLKTWCAAADADPTTLELVWIDRHHAWFREGHWQMPSKTVRALADSGASFLCLPWRGDGDGSRFHDEHLAGDERWCHAKLYALRRGKGRRLLLTSANFSASAWGAYDGDALEIVNFELGVCIKNATAPFDNLDAFEDAADVAATDHAPDETTSNIEWAQATWDGTKVLIEARIAAAATGVGARLVSAKAAVDVTDWTIASFTAVAQPAWTDVKDPPLSLVLSVEAEDVVVPVFDARASVDVEQSPIPEVDPDLATELREQILFERYGGRADTDLPIPADPPPDEELDTERKRRVGALGEDSYSVPAFVRAREDLAIVDVWANRAAQLLKRKTLDAVEAELLARDAQALVSAFERRAERDASVLTIGARMAAEELSVRLRLFEARSANA